MWNSFEEQSGRIKKIILHEKLLIMDAVTRIPVEDIVKVFKSLEF